MALTKNEMVQQVQDKTGLTKKESMAGLDGLFEIIKGELSHGKPVMISGFGKWTVVKKKARKGRNPQTGEDLIIDARKVVTFKPSNVLRKVL
ncbi:MAG TPA: integration host factor subunit alpha [Syntrophales bacterium]|jgi:integration host factor subunit alpha|nr:integration host factor subunit alpha [Deltaproteobacteria bacterium]